MVTVDVVHRLEVIEVEHEQRDSPFGRQKAQASEIFAQRTAVRKLGQDIFIGQLLRAPFSRLRPRLFDQHLGARVEHVHIAVVIARQHLGDQRRDEDEVHPDPEQIPVVGEQQADRDRGGTEQQDEAGCRRERLKTVAAADRADENIERDSENL